MLIVSTAASSAKSVVADSVNPLTTEGRYFAEEHGYNSRLDELHAEILRRKLRRLDTYIERRLALARRYDAALAGSGLELAARDILVNVSYRWPIHTMPAYAHGDCPEGSLPETEQAAREIFSLPMYPSLTDAQQDRVCEALHEILRTIGGTA